MQIERSESKKEKKNVFIGKPTKAVVLVHRKWTIYIFRELGSIHARAYIMWSPNSEQELLTFAILYYILLLIKHVKLFIIQISTALFQFLYLKMMDKNTQLKKYCDELL